MSSKTPIIKFSPFEALLIGEKNRILKRQPMKNTIFVTRLNRRRKIVNLRDLFGLEKSTKTDSEVIFKMPQRVCDFLKHRRLQRNPNGLSNKEKEEILCYEFEGCKMITKTSDQIILMGKNKKEKLNRVKFKRKFKCRENFKDKVVKKFPNPTRKRHYYESKSNCLVLKGRKKKCYNGGRHLLRGKDGKFICKSEYEKLKSKEISPKQKYLSNYLHQLYLKKNKQLFSQSQLNRDGNGEPYEMSLSVEAVVGLPNAQFDITASEATLNEVSRRYYENNCHEDFQFPKFPKELKPLDFENDTNLVDIIYENFPVVVRFESKPHVIDFSEALISTDILKPEKNVKMYKKKKNGFVKEEEIREILEKRFPLIKLERMNDIMPNHFPRRKERSIYASKIDEPFTRKSHLITGKSFGSFFFRSAEGKDIFIGNLMKPFLQNSWFGSLPEV